MRAIGFQEYGGVGHTYKKLLQFIVHKYHILFKVLNFN